MAYTDKEKASKMKVKIPQTAGAQHSKSDNSKRSQPWEDRELNYDPAYRYFSIVGAKKKAKNDPALRESTKNKEVVISSAASSSMGLEGDELVPVPKLDDEAWSLNNLPGDSTSESEADLLMDVNLAKESSKMAQNCQVSPTATEADASSARKHPELTKDDASSSSTEMLESNHRQTSDNILTTPTKPQWFSEFMAKKPTTPRLTSATNIQTATLQKEMKLLKQDLRKLQDQCQIHEEVIHVLWETTKSMLQANSTLAATLSSNNNRVDMHDKMIERLAARILALENQKQA